MVKDRTSPFWATFIFRLAQAMGRLPKPPSSRSVLRRSLREASYSALNGLRRGFCMFPAWRCCCSCPAGSRRSHLLSRPIQSLCYERLFGRPPYTQEVYHRAHARFTTVHTRLGIFRSPKVLSLDCPASSGCPNSRQSVGVFGTASNHTALSG